MYHYELRYPWKTKLAHREFLNSYVIDNFQVVPFLVKTRTILKTRVAQTIPVLFVYEIV